MSQSRYVTVMLVPDGGENGREFKIQQWLLKTMVIGLAVLLVGIILFFTFYGDVLARAAMTDRLEAENERLLRYQHKVKLLEENLIQTRQVVSRLVKLAGIDYKFDDFPTDSAIFAQLDNQATAVVARSNGKDFTVPSGLPLRGSISQEFHIDSPDKYHPGTDIACAEGTVVLTTASGEVIFAGEDENYGLMLVIKHSDSMSTVYGHNSELLVSTGEHVEAGRRIALSGNTGKSTAPHLHYEIRLHDEPINPMDQ
ncbi:MAG: M23 family metallopeptidase [bacterium]|nr:M23 family metallopeptidase [bacterium]